MGRLASSSSPTKSSVYRDDFHRIFGAPLEPLWTVVNRVRAYSPIFTPSYRNIPVQSGRFSNVFFTGNYRPPLDNLHGDGARRGPRHGRGHQRSSPDLAGRGPGISPPLDAARLRAASAAGACHAHPACETQRATRANPGDRAGLRPARHPDVAAEHEPRHRLLRRGAAEFIDSFNLSRGQIPYRDFYANYPPGSFLVVRALAFVSGGATIHAMRVLAFGLRAAGAALAAVVVGRLTRGRARVATFAAVLLLQSQVPVIMFAYVTAMVLALAGVAALPIDTPSPRRFAASGVLFGLVQSLHGTTCSSTASPSPPWWCCSRASLEARSSRRCRARAAALSPSACSPPSCRSGASFCSSEGRARSSTTSCSIRRSTCSRLASCLCPPSRASTRSTSFTGRDPRVPHGLYVAQPGGPGHRHRGGRRPRGRAAASEPGLGPPAAGGRAAPRPRSGHGAAGAAAHGLRARGLRRPGHARVPLRRVRRRARLRRGRTHARLRAAGGEPTRARRSARDPGAAQERARRDPHSGQTAYARRGDPPPGQARRPHLRRMHVARARARQLRLRLLRGASPRRHAESSSSIPES